MEVYLLLVPNAANAFEAARLLRQYQTQAIDQEKLEIFAGISPNPDPIKWNISGETPGRTVGRLEIINNKLYASFSVDTFKIKKHRGDHTLEDVVGWGSKQVYVPVWMDGNNIKWLSWHTTIRTGFVRDFWDVTGRDGLVWTFNECTAINSNEFSCQTTSFSDLPEDRPRNVAFDNRALEWNLTRK